MLSAYMRCVAVHAAPLTSFATFVYVNSLVTFSGLNLILYTGAGKSLQDLHYFGVCDGWGAF